MLTITQAFIQATQYVSKGNECRIHHIIPMFDRLHAELIRVSEDASKHKCVRHAALQASKIFDKYYSLTDESEVYRVAMSTS